MSKKVSFVRLIVPAGKAAPAPPVGPALGQRGVKAIDFCKLFNEKTKHYTPGTPIPVKITIQPDRTFTFYTTAPHASWFIKQAAGVEKGSSRAGEVVAGSVSFKHIYEIGLIKLADPAFEGLTHEQVCRQIVGQARGMGIEVKP